jgi:hypothetical protein
MPMADLSDNTNWSELDASNNKSSPNGWPEGMMPSGVNDSARNDKGALKRFWDRINPVQSITPASGIWTFTTGNPAYPTAYVDGEVYSFFPGADCAAGDQFQVNTLAAKPIYKRVAGGTGWGAIAAGDIAQSRPPQLVYWGVLNGGAGGFALSNPYLAVQSDGAGGLTLAGSINATGAIASNGPTAAFWFQDRTNNAVYWEWFADGNSNAYLYSSKAGGNLLNLDGSGNLTLAGTSLWFDGGATPGGSHITGDTTNISSTLGSGNGAWFWYNHSGGQVMSLNAAGALTVAANAIITTGLTVNGTGLALAVPSGNIQCGGTLTTGSTLTVGANATIATGLTVNASGLAVSVPNGNITCGGGCTFAANSTFSADLTINGSGTALSAPNGAISCGGTLTVGANATIATGLTVSGSSLALYVPNGNLQVGGTITAGSNVVADVFRHASPKGARIENWAGSSWDFMSFAMITGGYLGASPDNGSSGFNYAPNASFSDQRLKIDIRDTQVDALAAILATPVRAFSLNEEGKKRLPSLPEHFRVGLVAQEVEKTMPEVVHTLPEVDDMRMIRDHLITPYLIRALQQLAERVSALEAK